MNIETKKELSDAMLLQPIRLIAVA